MLVYTFINCFTSLLQFGLGLATCGTAMTRNQLYSAYIRKSPLLIRFSCYNSKQKFLTMTSKWKQPPISSNPLSTLSQVKRFDQINYVAKWQKEGEYFVHWKTLESLNIQLSSIEPKDKRVDKEKANSLFSELSTTYFARFHNVIREEYQVRIFSLGKCGVNKIVPFSSSVD